MKISTKGRYGLRAFIDLARYGVEDPVSISSIAQRQNLSEGYLEQLMAKLKRAGLIRSVRGSGGGYVLAKDAQKVSVGDVLRALEGNMELVTCAAFHDITPCGMEETCVTKYVWKKINESILHTIDEIKIATLVEQSRKEGRHGEKDDLFG